MRARQENLRHRESERGLSRQLRVAASFNRRQMSPDFAGEAPFDGLESGIYRPGSGETGRQPTRRKKRKPRSAAPYGMPACGDSDTKTRCPGARQPVSGKLVKRKLDEGVEHERLIDVIELATNERLCDAQMTTKRIIVKDPPARRARHGGRFRPRQDHRAGRRPIRPRCRQESPRLVRSNLPVTISFVTIGGDTEKVEGYLPLHHAVLVGRGRIPLYHHRGNAQLCVGHRPTLRLSLTQLQQHRLKVFDETGGYTGGSGCTHYIFAILETVRRCVRASSAARRRQRPGRPSRPVPEHVFG